MHFLFWQAYCPCKTAVPGYSNRYNIPCCTILLELDLATAHSLSHDSPISLRNISYSRIWKSTVTTLVNTAESDVSQEPERAECGFFGLPTTSQTFNSITMVIFSAIYSSAEQFHPYWPTKCIWEKMYFYRYSEDANARAAQSASWNESFILSLRNHWNNELAQNQKLRITWNHLTFERDSHISYNWWRSE